LRPPRRAKKIDQNQAEIVTALRRIPSVGVEVDHDDILVGYRGRTYWYELKNPDAVSKLTGRVNPSKIKQSQWNLLGGWPGHYKIVTSLKEILIDIGIEY